MQTTAFISWTAIPDVVNHRLFYRKLGTSGWTKRNFTANSYTIINLDPATDYEWKIRTLCEDGWTTISDASFFTTLAEGDDGSGDDGDDGDDGNGEANKGDRYRS